MHRAWVLGLLLGAEGVAREPRKQRMKQLKKVAASVQMAEGGFYPLRVPWITARVLIGLAKAGESLESSRVVRDACDWLRRPFPEGPYRRGTWESGTGEWNTTLATTAMCVNALVRCGVPATDRCVRAGSAYIEDNKSEWSAAGKEIDGAFAMETLLAVGVRWRELSGELENLISWARAREPWLDVARLASEVHDESCKVSQVASSLVGIVWDTVRAELPLLLEGLSVSLFGESRVEEETPDNLEHLKSAISFIKRRIEKTIEERQGLRDRKIIGADDGELAKWAQRNRDIGRIEARFRELTTEPSIRGGKMREKELVEAVNKLGEECLGRDNWGI